MKIRFTFLAFLLSPLLCRSQGIEPSFYESIKGDSVVMYFDNQHRFVEKKCALNKRYVILSSSGNFEGYFKDFNNSNVLLAKGKYAGGEKNGHFELFYANGKIQSLGNYQNNRPVGQWEFFYENGGPERTLQITENDTLLVGFNDPNGNVLIVNGKGQFEGPVTELSNSTLDIIAKGKVVDGKPDGKWTSTFLDHHEFVRETFAGGKLLRGVLPYSMGGTIYHNHPMLNSFHLRNYLDDLEKKHSRQCGDSLADAYNNSWDEDRFDANLRYDLNQAISYDVRTGKTREYVTGDNYLTIQFAIDEKGEGYDFKQLDKWGQQFFDVIVAAIGKRARFMPSQKRMYFHLILHCRGMGFSKSYLYDFHLSTSSHQN